jgi:hypothetical protein
MFVDSRAGAWKHAVSGLHAMETPGGAPPVAPLVEANPLFEQVARAARFGLEAHSGIASAHVIISGPDGQPEAQIRCLLTPSADLVRVAEMIESSLLGQIEALLGRKFAAVELRLHPAVRQHAA